MGRKAKKVRVDNPRFYGWGEGSGKTHDDDFGGLSRGCPTTNNRSFFLGIYEGFGSGCGDGAGVGRYGDEGWGAGYDMYDYQGIYGYGDGFALGAGETIGGVHGRG